MTPSIQPAQPIADLPLRRRESERRGFATLLVMGVVVLAALLIVMVQASAFSQASAGREALGRVRARWAARGGVESTIARLGWETENPDTSDAFKVLDSMTEVADGTLAGSSWHIATTIGKQEVAGPADAGAKLNINRLTKDQLLLIEPLMTEDIADAILDWIDPDDDAGPLGAEQGYYAGLAYPYMPRNAPLRSIEELELVAGVWAQDVRGEDWNLNGILDPNENDGNASWPPDNADGVLDAGWSGILTAQSIEGGLAASGQARLDLKVASENDLVSRTKVTNDQAKVIVDYVSTSQNATMSDFIGRDLQTLADAARLAQGGQGPASPVDALTRTQLAALLDETSIGPSASSEPGKLNINTCDAKTLEYLPEIDPTLADSIVVERGARPQGFTSIVDLLEVPGMTRRQLATIAQLLTVRSNVYCVTSRGRDAVTGVEVEARAVLDRSTLPVTIKDFRVQ